MNYKMKKRLMMVSMLIAILLVSMIGIINVSASAQGTAGEQYISYVGEGEYDYLTETNEPNGIKILKYAEDYFGNQAELPNTSARDMNILSDDEIIKIIPEKLFKKADKTLHIGKEYGFFVDCFQPKPTSTVLVSTVMIFDITSYNNTFDVENKSQLKITVHLFFKRIFNTL